MEELLESETVTKIKDMLNKPEDKKASVECPVSNDEKVNSFHIEQLNSDCHHRPKMTNKREQKHTYFSRHTSKISW
jgi:hypothetical protein